MYMYINTHTLSFISITIIIILLYVSFIHAITHYRPVKRPQELRARPTADPGNPLMSKALDETLRRHRTLVYIYIYIHIFM